MKRVEEVTLIEARLAMDYLYRNTKKPEISVEAYWQSMRDLFMIMPRSLMGVLA